jgi:hypothetical protein
MGLGEIEKRKLLDALDALTPSLNALSEPDRSNSTEVIAELRTEAAKTSPNMLRIRALGVGLATTVQAVGSMQPAYKALRTALTLIGVHLPDWP